MKKDFMPIVTSASAKKVLFAIFCCTLLMLFTAPAWAQSDPCTPALPVLNAGNPKGSGPACGVLITVTGTTGNLTATLSGGGTANGNPYDGDEDELIGIQNNTGVMVNNVLTGAVSIGAIRLSAPPSFAVPISVTCTSEGQVCSPSFSTNVAVTSPGPITVTYTAPQSHCSPVQIQFSVDGTVFSTSAFLNKGQSSGPIVTSPLSAGMHTVALQATGEVAGCNTGTLASWGGTLTVSGNITAPANSTPLSNLFAFDGDGPCTDNANDCFHAAAVNAPQNGYYPYDYEGPSSIFTGISSDFTTGTVRFATSALPGGIPPGGSTWFALESSPAAVVSIGETQQLATGVPNAFPFGPFTCMVDDPCVPGSGTWVEQTPAPPTPAVDDFVLTPLSGVTGADYWTVLPIPVPAGPLGSPSFGPFNINVPPVEPFFGNGQFGDVTPAAPGYGPGPFFTGFQLPNLPNQSLSQNSLACSPYTDYSLAAAQAAGQPDGQEPTCVEIERDCSGVDCGNPSLLWQAQFDYDQDSNSIPFLVGGPAALFVPDVPGPVSPGAALPFTAGTTDFTANPINSYTGATPTPEGTLPQDKPPTKSSGGDGKSVFVAAFSPYASTTPANQVPNGVTVGFPGFEVPTSNTSSPSCSKESAQYLLFPSGKQLSVGAIAPVNCLFAVKNHKGVEVPVPWLLVWDDTTTSSNTPVTNVKLCQTVGVGGACTTPALPATTNWVHLSLVPVSGCGGFAGQDPLSGAFLNLNPLFPGQYTFLWEPVSNPAGCQVAPLLQFNNNGTITYASPAVFVYSF